MVASRTPSLALLIGIVIGSAPAFAQTGATASDAVPPVTSGSAPAEIQPGHPPPAATGSLGASGLQQATEAILANRIAPGLIDRYLAEPYSKKHWRSAIIILAPRSGIIRWA